MLCVRLHTLSLGCWLLQGSELKQGSSEVGEPVAVRWQ